MTPESQRTRNRVRAGKRIFISILDPIASFLTINRIRTDISERMDYLIRAGLWFPVRRWIEGTGS